MKKPPNAWSSRYSVLGIMVEALTMLLRVQSTPKLSLKVYQGHWPLEESSNPRCWCSSPESQPALALWIPGPKLFQTAFSILVSFLGNSLHYRIFLIWHLIYSCFDKLFKGPTWCTVEASGPSGPPPMIPTQRCSSLQWYRVAASSPTFNDPHWCPCGSSDKDWTSMEIHQECLHFDVLDNLSPNLTTLQGIQ